MHSVVAFEWDGELYYFRTLALGLAPACWVYLLIKQELFRPLRACGLDLGYPIDDCLSAARTEGAARFNCRILKTTVRPLTCDSTRSGGPSTDAVAAASAGQLRAYEGLIRHLDTFRRHPPIHDVVPEATWTDVLTHTRAGDVASLAGTTAKLLRAWRTDPGGATKLARRFGLTRGGDAPEEGLQRRHAAVNAAAGASGAVLAMGSAVASASAGAALGALPEPWAAGGTGSGAGPDLPLAAACIALQVLLEAARLGKALAEDMLPSLADPIPPSQLRGVRPLEDLLVLLLEWLPPLVLAARPLGLAGTGSGRGAEAAADVGVQTPLAHTLSAAGAWEELLWGELEPAWALAAAVRLAPTCTALRGPLEHALWALAVRHPELLYVAIMGSERDEEGTGEGARMLRGPGIHLLREVLGPGGACEDPQLLTLLEALYACSNPTEASGLSWGLGTPPSRAQVYAEGVLVLASLAEARRALPSCSNPSCINLAGASEALLPVLRCGWGLRG
ncbi:hypothetical protein HYH03_009556 [Edaphochlamys debaryana]|uniref:Uncharacterized protein n=1 Tax=Edaphochlamys debaryana TaxID=47281 RepID=A0A836BY92_9CHLO|nr:hypothetical protein HYH03_009556 [Edaphochlamys debaryana]|eukprot:KAG2492058.1 hypothetical protein HYH03_009556 [Edaphochlamys debaryana]